MNKTGILLRIALVIVTFCLGGFLGTWILRDYNILNIMIFFCICSVLGMLIHKIDKIIVEKFSNK